VKGHSNGTGKCDRPACQARRLDLLHTGDPQPFHDTAQALAMVGRADYPPDLAYAFTYSTRAAAEGFAEINADHNTPSLGVVEFPGGRWLGVLDLRPQIEAIGGPGARMRRLP
jgi:hypothetical protein